jgi:uncharacterized membrane protein
MVKIFAGVIADCGDGDDRLLVLVRNGPTSRCRSIGKLLYPHAVAPMKKLLIAVSLLCLFLFGGVCGFTLALRIFKNSLNEESMVNQRIAEETRRLQLTPEQLEKAKPAYDQLKRELSEVKRETIRGIAQAAVTQTMELSKVLTSEQMDKLEKLSQERRAKFEKIVKP